MSKAFPFKPGDGWRSFYTSTETTDFRFIVDVRDERVLSIHFDVFAFGAELADIKGDVNCHGFSVCTEKSFIKWQSGAEKIESVPLEKLTQMAGRFTPLKDGWKGYVVGGLSWLCHRFYFDKDNDYDKLDRQIERLLRKVPWMREELEQERDRIFSPQQTAAYF